MSESRQDRLIAHAEIAIGTFDFEGAQPHDSGGVGAVAPVEVEERFLAARPRAAYAEAVRLRGSFRRVRSGE